MLKIGVTGGIGSGKSTVCRIFQNLGVKVFYSDIVARELLNTDLELKEVIEERFEKEMYNSDGHLDRQRMSKLVFNNPKALEELSSLVHPRVNIAFDKWLVENEKSPYVLKEAAILFESGNYHDLDKIINVFAPREERIQRVLKRDQVGRDEVERRMRFQYTDKERNDLADFIIVNEDESSLLAQIMELHEILLNENVTKI